MIINNERAPELSLYYIGSIVIEILQSSKGEQIECLYQLTKEKLNYDLHVDFFYYTLDWLYICSIIKLEDGRVSL